MASKKVLELGPGLSPLSTDKLDKILGEKNSYNIESIDYYTTNKPTYSHDIEKFPWPVKRNTYDIVYASHILEHVTDLVASIDEIYKILNKDGIAIILMPHGSCGYAWGHPTHKRVAASNTFDYFGDYPEKYNKTKGFKVMKKSLKYHRLSFVGKIITYLANRSAKSQFIFERFFAGYVGGFDEIMFVLKKIN
jgi:predicted SAM-dependent methyltransferase